jgi:hypothetical protein
MKLNIEFRGRVLIDGQMYEADIYGKNDHFLHVSSWKILAEIKSE